MPVIGNAKRTHGFLLWTTLVIACMLSFVQAADRNYRSIEGHLGKTIPPYQIEIVMGVAPAPYVYRQAVPQLRQLMMNVLKPGHVALLVDSAFALVAVCSSIVIGRALFKTYLVMLGPLVATLACVTVYPNDKPEAVASVAVVCLLSALVITRRQAAAILVAISAAPVRFEIPILFGFGLACGRLLVERSRLTVRHNYLSYGAITAVGAAYLLAARYLFWPEARFPVGVSPLTLARNLVRPLSWPALGFSLCLLGLSLAQVGLVRDDMQHSERSAFADHAEAMMGLGIFCLLYVVLLLFFAQAEEIRVVQPLLVPVILGGVWIQTNSHR